MVSTETRDDIRGGGVWIAVYALSMSWIFAAPFYADPNQVFSVVLVVSAVLLFRPASGLFPFGVVRPVYALWGLLAVPAAALLPGHYKVAPILVALAFVSAVVEGKMKSSRSLTPSLVLCAAVLLVQYPVEKLYDLFSARFHLASGFDFVLYGIVKFFGLPASLSDGAVFIQNMRSTDPMLITWEKLGILPILYLSAGAVALAAILRPKRALGRLAVFIVTMVMYVVVRAAFLVLLYYALTFYLSYESNYNFVTIFWNPVVAALTFLPLAVVLEFIVPFRFSGTPIAEADFRKPRAVSPRFAPALLGAGLLFVVGAYGFHDPGTPKRGRVLVDTGHSEWERVDRPYDTTWYGPDSGYNYYCLMSYLGHYFDVSYSDEVITRALLERCDVLIVKIPTAEFSVEEVAAIEEFVDDGGGLYLVGDHTNVFGSGVYLNDIARRFGFEFGYDCLFDIDRIFDEYYQPPALLRHPVLSGVPHILFQTSCSVRPLSPAYGGAIYGNKLKSKEIDYSSDNFYPSIDDSPVMKFGSFVQLIVKNHGKGRIVGFTDSTILSNFSAFLPGTSEMFVHSIDWLNRSNLYSWLNPTLAVLGAAALIAGLLMFTRRRPRGDELVIVAAVVLFCMTAGIVVISLVNGLCYGRLEPLTEPRRVVFDVTRCNYELPIYESVENPMTNYSIFYQWVQRLGYFPAADLEGDAVDGAPAMIVMINPNKPLTTVYREALVKYVESGGCLLMLDGPSNDTSSSNELLRAFGMRFESGSPTRTSFVANARGDTLATVVRKISCWPIAGGTARYTAEDGAVIGAGTTLGKGTVFAAGFARLFADVYMGKEQSVYPDESQLAYYNLEFNLVRGMLEGFEGGR
jgi:hypothetical protein